MNQLNASVRAELRKNGLREWQLADLLGITPTRLSSILARHELSQTEQEKLIRIIRENRRQEAKSDGRLGNIL